jgi:methionine sulfoxide reductase heme-binding subunit
MLVLVKPLVFSVCIGPALWLLYAVFADLTRGTRYLGPDPASYLALETGTWAIWMLIAGLALTPIRYLFNMPYAWRLRRMLGLFSFFYVSLHLFVFVAFILEWEWDELGREILERPYITIGFTAFAMMLPLAITSTDAMRRKMGRHWKRLHRIVYLVNVLAVMHVIWIIRSSYGEAFLYMVLVLMFLGYRVVYHMSPAFRRFTFLPVHRFSK